MDIINSLTVHRGDLRYLRKFLECEPGGIGCYIKDGKIYFIDINHQCPGIELGRFDEDDILVDSNGNVITENGNVLVERSL